MHLSTEYGIGSYVLYNLHFVEKPQTSLVKTSFQENRPQDVWDGVKPCPEHGKTCTNEVTRNLFRNERMKVEFLFNFATFCSILEISSCNQSAHLCYGMRFPECDTFELAVQTTMKTKF